jgi:formylglycine-generating enzyme required for sulfatase activity
LVPPGGYRMGAPDPGQAQQPDVPEHFVRLTKPFFIAENEVSQDEFASVMEFNPSIEISRTEDEQSKAARRFRGSPPVQNVSWDEAEEFCRRLSERPEESNAGRRYRLPTEAEW